MKSALFATKKSYVYIGVGLVLISVTALVYYVTTIRTLNLRDPQSITFASECAQLEDQIVSLLGNANYCDSVLDCTYVSLGCPFGCSRMIHTAYKDKLEEGGEKYMQSCASCVYDCDQAPTPDKIDCRNHVCVDTRSIKQ